MIRSEKGRKGKMNYNCGHVYHMNINPIQFSTKYIYLTLDKAICDHFGNLKITYF